MKSWNRYLATGAFNQILVSSTSFLISVTLAIILTPGEFGFYALTFSGTILVSAIITAIIITPMMIETQEVSPDAAYNKIKRSLFQLNGILIGISSALFVVSIYFHLITANQILAATVFTILYVLREFASRANLACSKTKVISVSNSIYFISSILTLTYVNYAKLSSAIDIILILAICNALALIPTCIVVLQYKPRTNASTKNHSSISVNQKTWSFFGAILIWTQTHGFTAIGALLFNIEIAGALAAARLILTPALTVLAGISQFLLPKIVQNLRAGRKTSEFDVIYLKLTTISIAYYVTSLVAVLYLKETAFISKYDNFVIYSAIWGVIAISQTLRDRSSIHLIANTRFRAITIATIAAQLPLIPGLIAAYSTSNPAVFIATIVATEFLLAFILKKIRVKANI
jgi:O-antigen/teichoic acid export membrane protein